MRTPADGDASPASVTLAGDCAFSRNTLNAILFQQLRSSEVQDRSRSWFGVENRGRWQRREVSQADRERELIAIQSITFACQMGGGRHEADALNKLAGPLQERNEAQRRS